MDHRDTVIGMTGLTAEEILVTVHRYAQEIVLRAAPGEGVRMALSVLEGAIRLFDEILTSAPDMGHPTGRASSMLVDIRTAIRILKGRG